MGDSGGYERKTVLKKAKPMADETKIEWAEPLRVQQYPEVTT